MKKFYLLMMFALLGMVANAQNVVFYESFDQNTGTGGNDGLWSGTIAQSSVKYDNNGWNGTKVSGANKCIKLGTGSAQGSITTPAISLNGDGTLTFKAGAWSGDATTISLSITNGGELSMTTIDLSNASFMDYTVVITNATADSKITFSANVKEDNRFFLDEVKVIAGGEVVEPTQVAAPTFSVTEGSYVDAQSIELSCATAGASIFYTINNGVETIYEAPIELSENGEYVIKAWAKKEGLEDSEVVTKTYTIDIFDGIVEDFDFATIVSENGYPTTGDGTAEFKSGIVTVTSTYTGNIANRFWSQKGQIQYRTYGDATLTFSVPAGYMIVKIELTPEAVADWTGEQQSVTLEIGKQTFTDFVVYYKQVAADQVLAPTFSLTSGTYEGTQSLSLNCETEGATIYYTMNGGETQTYADAIELTEGNEYAFVAWAEKDGMTKSSEVTANYTIVAPLVANSIAEFLTLGAENTDREITLNCDLTVTYQGSTKEGNTTRDLYVQDKDGKGLLIFNFDNPQLKKGDVISGVKGKYDFYNGVPELIEPVLGEVKETVEVAPVSVDASQLTVDNVNEYVVINNVELSEVNEANATLNDETATLALYNKYNACTYPEDLTKKYFVTGIVSVYKENLQIYVLEITEDTESGVNDAVANEFKAVAVANGIEVNVAEAGLVSVYNAAGQLVANVNVAEGATTINVAGGFYIVKAGNNVAKVLVK